MLNNLRIWGKPFHVIGSFKPPIRHFVILVRWRIVWLVDPPLHLLHSHSSVNHGPILPHAASLDPTKFWGRSQDHSYFFFFFFKFCLGILRKRSPIGLFASQMAIHSQVRDKLKPRARNSIWVFYVVQVLGSFSTAFPGTLTENWIRSGVVRCSDNDLCWGLKLLVLSVAPILLWKQEEPYLFIQDLRWLLGTITSCKRELTLEPDSLGSNPASIISFCTFWILYKLSVIQFSPLLRGHNTSTCLIRLYMNICTKHEE